MSDLIGDTRYDLVIFYISEKTGNPQRIEKLAIVGQHLRRAVADTVANALIKRHEVLVIEDGSYSFSLSRISTRSIDMLQNLTPEWHSELFGGVECMRCNALVSLADLRAHARRTWPAVPKALASRA